MNASVRWALLAIPTLGLLTVPEPGDYLAPTLLATGALAALLRMLGRPLDRTLPLVVLLLLLMVAYFLKFYLCNVLDPQALRDFLGWPAYDLVADRELMRRSFGVMALALGSFCATGVALLGIGKGRGPVRVATPVPRVTRFKQLFVATLAVMAVTGFVQFHYGLAVMGTGNVELPFRLAGVVVHSRNVLIPYLLLLTFHAAIRSGDRALAIGSFGALALHGVIQAVLMASRGIILFIVGPVGVLMLLAGRVSRRVIVAASAIVLVVAMTNGLFTELRDHRIRGDRSDITGGIRHALGHFSVMEEGGRGLARIFFRFTGVDGLVIATSLGDVPWDLERAAGLVFDPERSFARIYTEDFAGCRNAAVHQLAPGLVGYCYALGGPAGVVLGMASWTSAVTLAWNWLRGRRWLTGDPISSFVAFLVLGFSESGVFEEVPVKLGVAALGFAAGEWLARRSTAPDCRGPSPGLAPSTLEWSNNLPGPAARAAVERPEAEAPR